MKRFVSFIIAALILLIFSLSVYASPDMNTFADDGLPDDFYLLMESERAGDKLTLKVYLYNSPGLEGAKIKVCHNKAAVVPVSFENGEVWSAGDYVLKPNLVTLNPENDYFSVSTGPTSLLNNNEGLYFTAVYDILDDDADAGIKIVMDKKPFVATGEVEPIVAFVPTVINRVENSHSWTFDRIITEAAPDLAGQNAYVCQICGKEKIVETDIVPAWSKGDLDNNGAVNTRDAFIFKKLLAGFEPEYQALWVYDAADINGDGEINSKDSLEMKRIILGGTEKR